MSQVKNLRAMFENKGDKSPPDRGRSPAGSTSSTNLVGANGTGSPRPLSKVRTNFVAIEKDGRIGLRREQSGDSSPSRRRTSTGNDAEPMSTLPHKPATTSPGDVPEPSRRLFVSDPDPSLSAKTAGAVDEKSSPIPDSRLSHKQSPADLATGSTPKAPGSRSMTPSPSLRGSWLDERRTGASATPSKTSGTALKRPGIRTPAPPESQKKTAPNGSPRANMSTEPPVRNGTPRRDGMPKRDGNDPLKKTSDKLATTRPDPATVTRATTTAPKSKAKLLTGTSKVDPSEGKGNGDTALSKSRPRSTTKPVSVGPFLTAPTASSVSKGIATTHPRSRQSGSAHNLNASSRSTTRTNPPSASGPVQPTNRSRSAISRPKPSIGHPPSKSIEPNTSATKRVSHVDEGFLARMMRPTQASSSKTADKTPSTPPKKLTPRPSTAAAERHPRQAASGRKSVPAKDRTSKKSESNGSQQAGSGRNSADVKHELARAESTPQATSVTQDASETQKPCPDFEELQSPGDVLHIEPDEKEAAIPLEADPTQSHVDLQNDASSPFDPPPIVEKQRARETAEKVIGLAQGTDLIQQPVQPADEQPSPRGSPVAEPVPELTGAQGTYLIQQPVQPADEQPSICGSPAAEPVSELTSAHVTEGHPQTDFPESPTPREQPALLSDSSEPSKRAADNVTDEALEETRLAADGVDDAPNFKATDAVKADEVEDSAVTGSPPGARSRCEPRSSSLDPLLPMEQGSKVVESGPSLK